MEHILKKSIAIPALMLRSSLSGAKQSESAGENQTILEKIRGVRRELARQQQEFDRVVDNDLVESCIYRILALESEYRYLLGLARRRGVKLDNLGRASGRLQAQQEYPPRTCGLSSGL